MDNKTAQIIETLTRYAKGRANDVNRGIESPELSALLVEKYAVGLVDAVRALQLGLDINEITRVADELCLNIDPQVKKNREIRYTNYSKLDLSKPR